MIMQCSVEVSSGISKARRGFSSLELLVAFTLLMTVMASTVPLYVRHNRLLSESRRECLALEELANIAERIKACPSNELVSFINSLVPSQIVTDHLPGVVLTADLSRGSFGQRVLLEMYWKSVGRKNNPLRLAVWLPDPQPTSRGTP